jgi:hypothetical protein
LYNSPHMAEQKRTRLQLDIPVVIRNRVKAVAYGRGQSLVELYLEALTKINDPELTKLVEKELKERPSRGRPQD